MFLNTNAASSNNMDMDSRLPARTPEILQAAHLNSDPVADALTPIFEQLREAGPEMAHRFLVLAAQSKMSPSPQLSQWLADRIGDEGYRQLLRACAEHPCAVCRGGYEVCTDCRGAGLIAEDICDSCLGLGVTRCNYCGGSGWMAVDVFPFGMRCSVMRERVGLITAEMKTALALPEEKVAQDFRSQRSAFGRRALRWNRYLSVLENTVLAFQAHSESEELAKSGSDGVICDCLRFADLAMHQLRLALIFAVKGSHAQSSIDKRMTKVAAYYARFANDPSRHPELDHVFLRHAREFCRPARGQRQSQISKSEPNAAAAHSPSASRRNAGTPRRIISALLVVASISLGAAAARGDSYRERGVVYDKVRITGIQDARLEGADNKGASFSKELRTLEHISIDKMPSLARAEKIAAAGSNADHRAASALYKKAMNETNNRQMRTIIAVRAIATYEQAGLWLEAANAFFAVLESSPTQNTFTLRPTHFPEDEILEESAESISKRISALASREAKRLAKGFLLEIYLKSNDPRSAALVDELGPFAGELSRGMLFRSLNEVYGGHNNTSLTNTIEDKIAAGHEDDALSAIDSHLPTTSEDIAIHLFALKAHILEKQGKYMDAGVEYMRIAAYYPTHTTPASEAIWATACILEKMHKPRDARFLYREIVERYPESAHVELAKLKFEKNRPQ